MVEDHRTTVDRIALATLVDEATENLHFHDGPYREELEDAIQQARKSLD